MRSRGGYIRPFDCLSRFYAIASSPLYYNLSGALTVSVFVRGGPVVPGKSSPLHKWGDDGVIMLDKYNVLDSTK